MQDEAFKVTLAEFAAEKDTQKKATIKAKLDAEIAKRVQAEKEAAARPKPLYPAGTQAMLGENEALVEQATYDGKTWNYTIMINPNALILKKRVGGTEQQVKTILAEQIGQTPGPAYPKGLSVFRAGQGGLIEDVKAEGGTYSYQVKGWPNRVTESQLAAILGK